MHGISKRGTFNIEQKDQPRTKTTEDAMDLISSIMTGQKDVFNDEPQQGLAPILDFTQIEKEVEVTRDDDELRNKAMANLRERRMRLK